jgi:hypothetical protein
VHRARCACICWLLGCQGEQHGREILPVLLGGGHDAAAHNSQDVMHVDANNTLLPVCCSYMSEDGPVLTGGADSKGNQGKTGESQGAGRPDQLQIDKAGDQ